MGASSLLNVVNYSNGSNFSFDSSLIEIVGGKAQLKLQLDQETFAQDFSADTGFTYNSALAEFVAGILRQKSQRPTGALFHSKFDTKDGNWGSGSLTGTLFGAAAVAGGVLQLSNANDTYIQYAGAGNTPTGNKGCVRFRFKPNYSGSPTGSAYLFSMSAASNDITNLVRLQQIGTNIRIDIWNSAGASVIVSQTGNTFNPTAGQWYEFELNWDCDLGATRLFINGTQVGSTSGATGTLGARTIVRMGKDYTSSTNDGLDGEVDDLVIYDSPQHTANYTPGAVLPIRDYLESKVDLPVFTFSGVGSIVSVDSAMVTETGAPRYIIAGRYWNGSTWALSDGTYAQAASSAATIANLTSFPATGATLVPVSVVFGDTNTQGSVDAFSVTVTGTTAYPLTNPSILMNSGVLADSLESFEETAAVVAGSDAIRYTVNVNAQDKWWNGSAWATSNGTYAQSNTAAEIEANAATLDLSTGGTVKIRAFLHSEDGLTTPALETITFGYNFFNVQSEPATCTVWGFYRDLSGKPVQGAVVTFSLKRSAGQYREAGSAIVEKSVSVTTDAQGRFEVDLIRSSAYEAAGSYLMTIKQSVQKLDTSVLSSGVALEFTVPDLADVNITDRIVAVA